MKIIKDDLEKKKKNEMAGNGYINLTPNQIQRSALLYFSACLEKFAFYLQEL